MTQNVSPAPGKAANANRATTIRREWWSGDESMQVIADRHGVDITTVWRIIHRQAFADGPKLGGERFVDGDPVRPRPIVRAKYRPRKRKTDSTLPMPAEPMWSPPVLDLSAALREALAVSEEHGFHVERQPDGRFRARLGRKRFHVGPVYLSPEQARRMLRAGVVSPVIFAAAYPETQSRQET